MEADIHKVFEQLKTFTYCVFAISFVLGIIFGFMLRWAIEKEE